jgi:hypothetical protein
MSAGRNIVGKDGEPCNVVNGSLQVVVDHQPLLNNPTVEFPIVQELVDSTGSSNMAVDGSVTPIEFFIKASSDYDLYITQLSINIGDDNTPATNEFGDLVALTNGIKFSWFSNPEGELVIRNAIKTNRNFIRICNASEGVGSGTNAYLIDTQGGTSEKNYLLRIDFTTFFGMVHGLRLKKGSTDKIVFLIRDDLTTLVTFDIIASGKKVK